MPVIGRFGDLGALALAQGLGPRAAKLVMHVAAVSIPSCMTLQQARATGAYC